MKSRNNEEVYKNNPITNADVRKELDDFIGYAVKTGCLDEETALDMSYPAKLAYFYKSEVMANEKGD